MPAHDWTRVEATKFHHFHTAWMMELADHLNAGGLPAGYSAFAQHRADVYEPDVLTLTADPPGVAAGGGGVAVRTECSAVAVGLPTPGRVLAVRTVDDERLVAAIEIVSPSNKDRDRRVGEFVGKVHDLLAAGVHVVVLDVLPPGRHDPGGMHPAIWDGYAGGESPAEAPAARPLTFASYRAEAYPVANWSYAAVGQPLPDVPLFLDGGASVALPLEVTYTAVYARLPVSLRAALG